MKIQTFNKAFLIGVMLMTTSVWATPSATSLEKLAAATPYEEVFFEEVISPLSIKRMQLIQSLQADTTLTDKQREDALKIYETYAENLVKSLDNNAQLEAALKTAYMNAAKENFTQAEVDAQVAFYGSASGKSALQKREAVLQQYMQSAAQAAQSSIESYESLHLAKMEADMKAVLGK